MSTLVKYPRYKLSSRYNKANCEIADEEQDPTTVLARFVFSFKMMIIIMQ